MSCPGKQLALALLTLAIVVTLTTCDSSSDTVIADPGPWRVGKLVDGERMLSLPLTESGDEAFSTRDPAVVPWDDGWLMVYVGMGDDGRYRLMSATSDVCSR